MALDAKTEALGVLMSKVNSGEVQLPDFQRDWVWSDEQIASLIESVVRRFPINAIILLEHDANNITFKYRPIEGTPKMSAMPTRLVLDGQQRLTSLYNALFSAHPVKVRKGRGNNDIVERYYYLDMEKTVRSIDGEDVEGLVISVPKEEKLNPEQEYDKNLFPLNQVFNSWNWHGKYLQHHQHAQTNSKLASKFGNEVCDKVTNYQVTEIIIEKKTPLASVCTIFEKVNVGGVILTVFELLTAKFAAYKLKTVNLRKDIEDICKKFSEDNRPLILKEFAKTERDFGLNFITALTLVTTFENSNGKSANSKRESLLKLTAGDYLKFKDFLIAGFFEAGKFLTEEEILCKRFMPYESQLIPLAAIFADLKFHQQKINAAIKNKIREWFWCGIFGEMYNTARDSQYAVDIVQVLAWIKDGKNQPLFLKDLRLDAFRIITLRHMRSAVYTGIMLLILKNGAQDFLTGDSMKVTAQLAEDIDGHHIFPKKFCKKNLKLAEERYDNAANKTPILASTNRNVIKDKAPSQYLANFDTKIGKDSVDKILKSHFVYAEFCRADDFDAFIVDRAKKILDAIEKVTKHKVVGRDSQPIVDIFGAPLT